MNFLFSYIPVRFLIFACAVTLVLKKKIKDFDRALERQLMQMTYHMLHKVYSEFIIRAEHNLRALLKPGVPCKGLSCHLSREEASPAIAFQKIMQQDFHPSPFFLQVLMGRSGAKDGTNHDRDKAYKSLGKIHKSS